MSTPVPGLSRLFVAVSTLIALTASAREMPSFDAFHQPDPEQQGPSLRRGTAATPKPNPIPSLRSERGAVGFKALAVSREGRLDVPTFMWAVPASQSDRMLRRLATQEQSARGYLSELAPAYGLSATEGDNALLQDLHDLGTGPVIATFRQQIGGVEVFRNELKLVMDRNLALVAASGYLSPHGSSINVGNARSKFRLDADQAVLRAFEDLSGHGLNRSELTALGSRGGHEFFDLTSASRSRLDYFFVEPARAKPVFFQLSDRLVSAYYVELQAGDAGGLDSDVYAYVISAEDGTLLYRNDLTVSDSFSYRVWADSTTFIPYDGPQGNAANPHATGIPSAPLPPLVSPNLVTLQNAPFSQNDPWLAPGATETFGNNVDAYIDAAAPDGRNTALLPDGGVDPRDFRATATAPDTFDRTYDTTVMPNVSADQQMAAITAMFYMNNWLHDWFYDSGFNEAAGNAQTLNFGRGGEENDPIRAEAQDYGGTNNANMSTPADGSRPRMQMYLWPQSIIRVLSITSPASLAREDATGYLAFGAQDFDVTAEVVPVDDGVAGTGGSNNDGCQTPFVNAADITGKIALVERTLSPPCTTAAKVKNAQDAGAIAVLVANSCLGQTAACTATTSEGLLVFGGVDATITIGGLATRKSVGDAIKATYAGGTAVTVRLRKTSGASGPTLDSSVDNGIMAHEWGHYLSNRLISNGAGLSLNQARSMGEGWSDFVAMLLQFREEDFLADPTVSNTYAVAQYSTNAQQYYGASESYYYGIRRVPYSTDFTKNALSFRHIQTGVALPTALHPMSFRLSSLDNAQFHNSGEVWATTLWGVYAGLLKDPRHSYQQAQDKMKAYLVAGLKLTPANPTFLEARNALLAAAYASDPQDFQTFWQAFAARGMGVGALGPDRTSTNHATVTESFSLGNDLRFVGATITDDDRWCDRDGVLDSGESGYLTVVMANSGAGSIQDAVVTVTGPAGVSFPYGNTVQFAPTSPLQTASARIAVRLDSAAAISSLTLNLSLNASDMAVPGAVTGTFTSLVNYDENFGQVATDDVESVSTVWTTPTDGGGAAWTRLAVSPTDHHFRGANAASRGNAYLVTPQLNVSPTDPFSFTFQHRHSFEAGSYDGGRIEITTNGTDWVDVGPMASPGYNGVIVSTDNNPLAGEAAYVNNSTGYPAWNTVTVSLGTTYAGQTVQVRFRVATDPAAGAEGWDLDNLAFSGLTNTPFPVTVADNEICGDTRPFANATADFSANERTVATLGSSSSDPDGDSLEYSWSQSGTDTVQVSLRNGSTASAEFDAPEVTAPVVLNFLLTVTDPAGNQDSDPVVVTINHVNRDPVVSAAADYAIDERSLAQLVGSGTELDADQTLTYGWAQDAGDAVQVSLNNADQATASFSTPEVTADTLLTFHFTVSDNEGGSSADSVTVTVRHVNRNPEIASHPGLQVAERTAATTLTGVASDLDANQTLSYLWTQAAADTLRLTLQDTTTAAVTFDAPEVQVATEVTLNLVVSDSEGGSSSQDYRVLINNVNRNPRGRAPPHFSANERTPVSVVGAGEDDDEGTALTYRWTQVAGASVVLQNADQAEVSFQAPEVTADTVLTFSLIVSDGEVDSEPANVNVTIVHVNRSPTAAAGDDQSVAPGVSVTLTGIGTDPDEGDALSYEWTQIEGPNVSLTGANTASPSFVAPELEATGTLSFRLTVKDSSNLGFADTVRVTVEVPEAESCGGCASSGGASSSMLWGGLLLTVFLRRRRKA